MVAAAFHSPLPLIAGEGGGARALIPMSEVPVTGAAPETTGAVEAPAQPVAAEPVAAEPVAAEPVAAEAPQLVPPDQVGSETAPEAAPAPAPAPAAPEDPPQLKPQAELAQATVPEPSPQQPPARTPEDPAPGEETDPEEFEEDFDVPARPAPEPGAPVEETARVSAGERLPQTGTDLAAIAGSGFALMALGLWLRCVRPAPRTPRPRPVRKLPSAHAHARALRPPPGTNLGLPAHRWVLPPLR